MAREYTLGQSPEVEVVVDGEACGLRVGQLAVLGAVARCHEAATAMSAAADDAAAVAASEAYCAEVGRMAALAFGEEAAGRLLAGDGATDAVRLARLVGAVEAEMSSPEASAAIAAALRGDATADE